MNDKEFDKRIKELADSYMEPVGAGVWEGVEKGLVRRNRMILFKRAGYIAAAACLAAGVILYSPSQKEQKTGLATVSVVPVTPRINEKGPEKLVAIALVRKTAAAAPVVHNGTEHKTVAPHRTEPQEAVHQKTSGMQKTKPETSSSVSSDYNYFTDFEEPAGKPARRRQPISISASSNVMAANPGSSDFSTPQYSPGYSSASNYGVLPISEPRFYFPISFGIQMQIPLTEKFYIGAGVNYSILHSKYEALIDNSVQGMVEQNLHYIGVPVSVYFSILKSDIFDFYVSGGGMLEKGLQSKCRIKDLRDAVTVRKESISGIQWSANLGLGFEYRFVRLLGVYLDPSLIYFFESGQPFSVRTSQPLQFKLELGLRFHF